MNNIQGRDSAFFTQGRKGAASVLLVNPKMNVDDEGSSEPKVNEPTSDYPLNIIYLAGYLESRGHKVRIIDAEKLAKPDSLARIDTCLEDVDLVGITVMTPALPHTIELCDFIKMRNPEMPIVWGGIHPTLFPHQSVKDEVVDFVVVGEGEVPLNLLARSVKLRDWASISEIPNVTFKGKAAEPAVVPLKLGRAGKTLEKARRTAYLETPIKHNLAKEPLPGYHLLDMKRYLHVRQHDGTVRRTLELITSRGCPYRCSFCVDSIVDRGKWRSQPVSKTIEDIRVLVERYSIEHIFFMDENFFVRIDRVIEIIRSLVGLGLTWEGNIRAEVLSRRLSDEALSLMRDTGCTMLRIGAESGSPRMLRLLQKDNNPEDILKAVRRAHPYGIVCNLSFMIAVPGETKEDMEQTMALIAEIGRIAPETEIIGPQPYRPYPGSILYDQLDAAGLLEKCEGPRDWVDSVILANMRYLNVVSARQFDDDAVDYLRELGYIVESDPEILKREIELHGDRVGRRFQGRLFHPMVIQQIA